MIIDVDNKAAARVKRKSIWLRKRNGDGPRKWRVLWLVLNWLILSLTSFLDWKSILSNIWYYLRNRLWGDKVLNWTALSNGIQLSS